MASETEKSTDITNTYDNKQTEMGEDHMTAVNWLNIGLELEDSQYGIKI